MSDIAFTQLDLPVNLTASLTSLGYQTMTPVQSQVLPLSLAGRDVIAKAKTGSGKTVAFALTMLAKLDSTQFVPQSLVLCPTRELADQIAEVTRQLARETANVKVLTLTGGSSTRTQIGSLEKGSHIIVGTPGRIEDHIGRGSLKLEHIDSLVLDEADRMLQMGFLDAIDRIIKMLPSERQTLLLSATYPAEIESVSNRVMKNPAVISVDTAHSSSDIQQYFYRIDQQQSRPQALQRLLLEYNPESALVFCNTKIAVREVTKFLTDNGFSAVALHGDLEQRERDQNLIRFSNRSVVIMVATDVAARGLDIEKLDVVINYELSKDLDVHIHRSGRTGRAGEVGMVWTLFDEADRYRIENVEKLLREKVTESKLPSGSVLQRQAGKPLTVTLEINAGKKQKIRPGDILGALTGDGGIAGDAVGKIRIQSTRSFVSVDRHVAKQAHESLKKIKGRAFKTRVL